MLIYDSVKITQITFEAGRWRKILSIDAQNIPRSDKLKHDENDDVNDFQIPKNLSR